MPENHFAKKIMKKFTKIGSILDWTAGLEIRYTGAEADLRSGSEGGIWDLRFLGSLKSQIR